MGQAAILAVGAIREVPAVRDGEIVPAQLMKATLSCDHRILYGAEGAEFLARVKSPARGAGLPRPLVGLAAAELRRQRFRAFGIHVARAAPRSSPACW